MPRSIVEAALIGALATIPLAGCASTPPGPLEPEVRVVEVAVPTPVPCPALAALGDEPEYPDTDAAIRAAPGIGELARLYARGRLMRIERLAEYSAAKSGCIF